MRIEDLDSLNRDYCSEDFCKKEVQRYEAVPGGRGKWDQGENSLRQKK